MRYLLAFCCAACCAALLSSATPALAGPKLIKLPVAEYEARVYASWLGQCIGNLYGLPHELKYLDAPGPERFPYGYSSSLARMKAVNGVFSDDDTDFEYVTLVAMERYGIEPTYAQLVETWQRHVRDFVWLANRTALALFQVGYTPPLTGSRALNPHWFQIDPQLINEIWGITAPGMVRYAAAKSAWAARITADEWGVEPTMHIGAMYAAAFFEHDIAKLIDIGKQALPPRSRFATTIEQVKALHRRYPHDWKAARAQLARIYFSQEPEETRTVWNANLNAAAGLLALLYGGGHFQRTLDLACALGFDADNQAATMAGLLGLIVGREGLPRDLLYPLPGWKEPLNDRYKNVTRHGLPDAGLKEFAAREARQGEKIILRHGGQRITENGVDYYLINPDARFHVPLELPAGPLPPLEVGVRVSYAPPVSGGQPPYGWRVFAGKLPRGLTFARGVLSGVPAQPGVFPLTLELTTGSSKRQRSFVLVVRDKNLAPAARRILARVERIDAKERAALFSIVPGSLLADSVAVIRDGKRTGPRSTFYSLSAAAGPQLDFYGYEWDQPQRLGLLAFHSGTIEEAGGWFTTLGVEYRDAAGAWKPVSKLLVSPRLPGHNTPMGQASFVEHLLAFEPVMTRAIRIMGQAGGLKHVTNPAARRFTSITELGAYGPLPGCYGPLPDCQALAPR